MEKSINSEKFNQTEQRLIELQEKLKERIRKTDQSSIEAKKIREEIEKLRMEIKAGR